MTLLQAMLSIGVAFVPLPGASVATEGGFYALFTTYFGDSRLIAMLIWRFFDVLSDHPAGAFGRGDRWVPRGQALSAANG